MPGRWSVVGVTVVGGLRSVAGRWAVVLYYAIPDQLKGRQNTGELQVSQR